MKFRIFLTTFMLYMVTCHGAVAQTKDRLDRRDKLLGFEAVGRLESANSSCTAVLIARDVVLTAAHCVYGQGQEFVFRAGFRDGAAIATRTSDGVVIAQGYTNAMARKDRVAAIANDLALVSLASPIFEQGINPYGISAAPRRGTALTLASYGRGRMEALTLERGCKVNTLYRDGIVGIDCDATFGSSGAPVFVQVGAVTRVVSIVSSVTESGNGRTETLGVALSSLVPEMQRTLRNMRARAPVSEGQRRVTVGERSMGGARFVRPNQ